MATQASAITFLSMPGQAYEDGMGFVQFYFGLPIAMVILSAVIVPIYYRLKVYTAYEYLETRFDRKTRQLTALLFLLSRGLGAGISIYAPAIVLSTVLGWPLQLTNLVIGGAVILYTVSGGTRVGQPHADLADGRDARRHGGWRSPSSLQPAAARGLARRRAAPSPARSAR